MAKCDICGKGVSFGIKVSHSHKRSNRAWKPNVRRVKVIVDGTPRHIYACTSCLRSNLVTRAVKEKRGSADKVAAGAVDAVNPPVEEVAISADGAAETV